MHNGSKSTLIKTKALELGFSLCGIAPVRKLKAEEKALKAYLANCYHGEMKYMANHFDKRLDPSLLVPGAKSMVLVLLNYFPRNLQQGSNAPKIAKYAYGTDYHYVIKDKLKALLRFINEHIAPANGRVFTDSAPVLERAWAVQAGLGWIGKNGLLINRQMGSFFLIGELIIDLELEYDEPYYDEHCGSCNQCLNACPTHALVEPYVLDARKCISYLTIELKAEIPETFRPMLSQRIFGCDICQDVCPWNRKVHPTSEPAFSPHPEMLQLYREAWMNLSKNAFNELFRKSALKRAGYQKIMQNISYLYEKC
ncbi:MAG: tRNA epoxyqueuosine(34) reductase QueG [Prolixibacteraceae bacterium]|nr:tRNA epoxyqueuosine(34) reductase QueG [Prolixibacteraceae bacterium]MBN2648278.1 tRNA epoxyqueuosine(34) reductase QueG [Prolixibacteraceae bacterium]